MRKTERNSDKSDFRVELGDDRVVTRRQTGFLPDGAYLFEDELNLKGELTAKVITCTAWLLELYELKSGELFSARGETEIRPAAKCFGVFYPPFTISQLSFKNVKGLLTGVAGSTPLPAGLTPLPVMFETTFAGPPTGAAQVLEVVRSGNHLQSIELNPRPSLLSLRAKRLIDSNHLAYPSISRVAARLRVTHEHLSRQFKRDFQLSPRDYLRRLRVADAPLRLARGEEIINVSQDVGYNDLSRFYKQFRKSTNTSPGVCQTMMRPRRA
jgi:AraC-like DNA-binding protein